MKRLLMTLAVVVVLTVANVSEAAGFTHEQLDKILAHIEQNPAVSPANTATLKLDIAQLQSKFNAELEPMFNEVQFDSDEEREVMEKLFLIKDYKTFEADNEGKVFLNVFGNSVAIFGVLGNSNDRFKLLTCACTKPDNQNEMTVSSIVLASFVKVILPNADPEKFLNELSAAKEGNVIRNGMKFTLTRDDGFMLVTAVKEG